jgi:hypothetical protein
MRYVVNASVVTMIHTMLVSAAFAGVTTTNIVTNPGMESGTFSGWIATGGAGISTDYKRSGQYGVWVFDGPGAAYQDVDVSTFADSIDSGFAVPCRSKPYDCRTIASTIPLTAAAAAFSVWSCATLATNRRKPDEQSDRHCSRNRDICIPGPR